MGIANDLKGFAMFGRSTPKPFLLLLVLILLCVYDRPALAKPRPEQFLNQQQWTGDVREKIDRHWSDIDSIENTNGREKRRAWEREDTLKNQKGFQVLTASNDKREGIVTPIQALQDSPSANNHGQNLRSNVNEPTVSSSADAPNVQAKSQQANAASASQNDNGSGGSSSTSNGLKLEASLPGIEDTGQKRGDVSDSKTNEAKPQVNNEAKTEKQDNKGSSSDNNQSVNSAKPPQGTQTNSAAPSSVTIQGNTVNGKPIGQSNAEPIRDSLGNSGSEVVTSHPLYENQEENNRLPYRDARSKSEPKESTEPEVGHFQVDDKSADLEINANSAGVKVKAKPASLQVVSRPGSHPPTPIVPVAAIHPYYHHYHPYYDSYRRSTRPYHRRLYDNPYHAHYRAWIPPPGHHHHRYFRDPMPMDVPFYRRAYDPYGYRHRHHRHHHHHRPSMYLDSDLYDRSDIEDGFSRYRRRFHGPYRRRMYGRGNLDYEGMPDARFHIPRGRRPYVRHDIITPEPPPVNVYGNPPPGVLNGSPGAGMMGMNGVNSYMPSMGNYGMGMREPGMREPGPGFQGMMDQGFDQQQENGFARYFGPRNVNGFEPRVHVKKASIQGAKNIHKAHVQPKPRNPAKKSKGLKRTVKKSHNRKSNLHRSDISSKAKHRLRRSVENSKTKKYVTKLHAQKKKEQKGARKNSIVIHRPPIIYHPPPEIYHRPDIVVHRAAIMLHRPAIIYHQPPVVVHRPAIIYHQPSIVFHQPPPVVHQPIMHSHDTYVTRPVVLHSSSAVSHATNYLGIPDHVISGEFDGYHGYHGYHGYNGFHGDAFRKHSVPHSGNTLKTVRAEIQGKIFKKSDTVSKATRPKRDIYTRYLDDMDTMSSVWQQRKKRNAAQDDFDVITSKEAADEALSYTDGEYSNEKRDTISRPAKRDSRGSTNRKKREFYEDSFFGNGDRDVDSRKKKKDVVVNRPPIIYHPPPEVYHRPDIVVHRPPLVIHRPPIIYHQPPVIVHRPAVVYHQPPIVFHQPPPAVSQPLLFSHDSFTVHPSFYATHHGSVVRDYGHYIGIPNIVSNYGAPLFHSRMGKRSKIARPLKSHDKGSKKIEVENAHKKNSVVIRRPPIIYHPPPEIYHRPDIVVHRAPIMIHRAPIVYHQPPVVVHRPAIVYHQPSIVFHQPPPVVHQPMVESHDTYVTHSVAVPLSSHVSHHAAYVGIPKDAYMNYHGHWTGDDHHGFYKSEVPKVANASARDKIIKHKKHAIKKKLKHKKIKEEKAKKKNSVMVKRPPIIYHPPPEIFHRPDIVVHRPPIMVHRAPIIYHQPPVIVHRPAIVYHQPNIVFHQPMPMVHQPIMKSHDTWVARPAVKLYGSTMHSVGAVTQIPHAYYHGHNHLNYMAYGKSKVPIKNEKPAVRDEIKHGKATSHDKSHDDIEKADEELSGDDDDDDDNDDDDDSGFGSGSGDLDIEVIPEKNVQPKLRKSKTQTESASKKDSITKQKESTEKGSKKNSVVIHRPPIIYHPPPEIYHRPDIVVHRAPIVLYRAPIIYHQPPVVVHRPAIVYHQPSIVFHQPPPVVHQPIMHSHDTYVTHSVAVPVGSHITHMSNYHGVPHEAIYMEGIGHGAFSKSELPSHKGNRRDKVKSSDIKPDKRSRRSIEGDELPPETARNVDEVKKPIGAGYRIRRALEEQPWVAEIGEDVNIVIKRSESSIGLGLEEGDKGELILEKRSVNTNHPSHSHNYINHSKKTVIIIRRPPILYHPPSHVIHRPNVMVHRPPFIVHRHPLIIHRPSILVHRMPIVIHRPPILIHRSPMVVRRPDLMFHRPPLLIHRMPYVVHPHPWLIHRPPIVIHKGPQMMIHHSSYIHHYPSHVVHMGCHGCGCGGGGGGGWCGKSKVPRADSDNILSSNDTTNTNLKSLSDDFASDLGIKDQGISKTTEHYKFSSAPESDPGGLSSFDFKISESPLKQAEGFYRNTLTNRPKRSIADPSRMHAVLNKKDKDGKVKSNLSKKKKKDVVVSRPPIIYHPPPEVYHRPEIIVHRAPILIHRPPIVYHQPPVVVHRPAVVYHQPPIVFHQPPPSVNQPLLYSRDQYIMHPSAVAQHINSVVNEGGHYIGIPHGGVENYPGSLNMQPYGHMLPAFSMPMKRGQVQRPVDKKKTVTKDVDTVDKDDGSTSGENETPSKTDKKHKSKSFKDPLSQDYHGENLHATSGTTYTKTKVSANKKRRSRSAIESTKRKVKVLNGNKLGQKKGDRKNTIIVHRPPMIYHPPPEIYDRPNVVVHRPDLVFHRPSIVYHQPSVVLHRPPVIYHEPPVVFHQPPPMVRQPIVHSHDSYIGHRFYEPYGSHIEHTGMYMGAPHFYPPAPYSGGAWGSAFGKSQIERKDNSKKVKATKHSKRSTKQQKKTSNTGSKKNQVLIMRPPMIYHPPPEIYDRPSIVVHRPDLVIHRPSIVYHQPSVVIHRPPVVYQQPPVVFHQPAPMNSQPVIHSHDSYMAHTYHEPFASSISHTGTYVGAPHFFPGGWGGGPEALGPAFGKSKVPKVKTTSKKVKRESENNSDKKHSKVQKSKEGNKKNIVIAHRPPMIYHPPPEIYDRPAIVVHRPDIVIHRPAVVYHQPSVVVHRPPIIYHEPPVVFHQPSPMVHHPIVHSHDTYIGHSFYEPYASQVSHAGTYVGAPHFYGGGFGYGYGGFGPAFGKSKVSKHQKQASKITKDTKSRSKRNTKDKHVEKKTKTTKSHKTAVAGHKKNVVIMRRPPVVYHPPPEVYHRPDVVLHRPDIVIHRPSVVFHQPAVVVHRPAVIYHQPPIVFHQPSPMVHQPIIHSHETYLPHHYYEPTGAHVHHTDTYVGAPHFFHGGWGWGYGMHAGNAFGKSKVEAINNNEIKKAKSAKKEESKNKKEDDDDDKEEDDDDDDDDDYDDGQTKISNPKSKSRRSINKFSKEKKTSKVVDGHKKNIVVMNRPPVVYHPPPEIYHRPDVVLHRPDIVIHRPSVVFHQSAVLLHRPAVVYHQPPIVFHQPSPMVHQPIIHSQETYLPHHFYEPYHQHMVHGGTYVGAPHFFGGGWGWGYGHGHAFGKSEVEKTTKKTDHHKNKKGNALHKRFKKLLTKRSILKKTLATHSNKGSKKSAKGNKKNMVLIHRPPMIYHPPPEIYDRPSVVVHRPDLVYHQPSIVYHQPSVVIHRPSVIYRPPPVVFHQPPPLVRQNVLHAHDSYLAHHYFEPYSSQIHHDQTYIGAPHFFGGGWGYGFGLGGHGPVSHPNNPWNSYGMGMLPYGPEINHNGPFYPNGPGMYHNGPPFNSYGPTPFNGIGAAGFHGPMPFNGFHGPMPFNGFHGRMPFNGFHGPAHPSGPAFTRSGIDKLNKTKGKALDIHRHPRSLTSKEKNKTKRSNHVKSNSRHHKGLKKNVVVVNRPPVVFQTPPDIYHRPDVVMHRPDIVIHRPPIVMHQAPVVVHKPALVYHQSPIVYHQPPPVVHQPIMYSHDAYVPHPYYEPFGSQITHTGTYFGAPHAFDGGWGFGYGHAVGGFGKSKVEKNKTAKKTKAHKAAMKNKTESKQENATKKENILHAEIEKEVNPDKKNDIVVNRPPIIYHPPPEVYHRPDIVVHRAPIVLHRPPIIYHQPPVVVHRPAVVYHQPPIVFHQPPPAVHQPIIHSHDTFVVHHSASYEPHGSTVSHETNYIGIPSHVEHYDEGFDFDEGHHGMHDDGYHGGFHGGYHGGYHGFHGYHNRPHYRSTIGHVKEDAENDTDKGSTKSTIPKNEMPTKNTHTTDDDEDVKTVSKRQLLGSHSLFMPLSPLNYPHSKGPIVERLQKMSTIPGVPSFDFQRHVAKRNVDSHRQKRQLAVNPNVIQAPFNYGNANELASGREIQQEQRVPYQGYAPQAINSRLPYVQSLLQNPFMRNPFIPGYLPMKSPGVSVHVQTERSKIPGDNKRKPRQRRQVLPFIQPQLFGALPHFLYNQPPAVPLANLHAAAPQLPPQFQPQLPAQFLGFGGYHPMMLPSPFMNYGAQRRPHVNINVQSARSDIPNPIKTSREKRTVTERQKRQLFPPFINPYVMALNSRNYAPFMGYPNYRPYNPYWNINPFFYRRGPEIPHHEDEEVINPYTLRSQLINQYLTNLYEYYTGEMFHRKRPKVNVEVHASKSDIPGSKPRDIIVRTRRQVFNYLPVSPLTTGHYHLPITGAFKYLFPVKRNSIPKSKRSTNKITDDNKEKKKNESRNNNKRDKFTPRNGIDELSNMMGMNPDNPGALQFNNGGQNDRFPAMNAGAEGLNEIGPGGLNGAERELQVNQPQSQRSYGGAPEPEEQNVFNSPETNALRQQQFIEQQPRMMEGVQGNGLLSPNFAQMQEMQAQNRMALPMNAEGMLRNQAPYLPFRPQLLPPPMSVIPPGPGLAPFFPRGPESLPYPMPIMRTPMPFAPYEAQMAQYSQLFNQGPQMPSPYPYQFPVQPVLPATGPQPSIDVNVNTAKSNLPGAKLENKKNKNTSRSRKQIVPAHGIDQKNSHKRQRISLLRRVPALQVLPQRFLQNGVLVPSFSSNDPHKESSSHGVNGMIISELQMQRKHAIPNTSEHKQQTLHKRQFYQLPENTVYPELPSVPQLDFPVRPRVHVHVQVEGKKKSEFASKEGVNKESAKSHKERRQIYGMNELPNVLRFPADDAKLSNNERNSKKFKIRKDESGKIMKTKNDKRELPSSPQDHGRQKDNSQYSSYVEDPTAVNSMSTSLSQPHTSISHEIANKKSSLSKSKNPEPKEPGKRQFVNPFGPDSAQYVAQNGPLSEAGINGLYGENIAQQVVQAPQVVNQYTQQIQPAEQLQPYAQQFQQGQQVPDVGQGPQGVMQDHTQSYVHPEQQLSEAEGTLYKPHRVNVDVQVSKSAISKSIKNPGKKSLLGRLKGKKAKKVSKRTVNNVAETTGVASSVDNNEETKTKRQLYSNSQPLTLPVNQQYQSPGSVTQPFQYFGTPGQQYQNVPENPYQQSPKVSVNVQTSRSNIRSKPTPMKRQLYNILGRPQAQRITQHQQLGRRPHEISRRSLTKKVHVPEHKLEQTVKKEKRQLEDLISNIIQRRRGPKLIGDRPKPPIMFTTNANNQKPIEIFPGDPAGNAAPVPDQTRPNIGGTGNPFAGPQSPLQPNQGPVGNELAAPRNPAVFQDDQSAIAASQQQLPPPSPFRQQEPDARQNVLQFLQNAGLPNLPMQQQMIPQPFMGTQVPLPFPPSNPQPQFLQNVGLPNLPFQQQMFPQPFMGAPVPPFSFPPLNPRPLMDGFPNFDRNRAFGPVPGPPFLPPFPPIFPMGPQPQQQSLFPPFSSAPTGIMPGLDNPSMPGNQDNDSDDRPSVNVNVETSKSKIPKQRKT